jgi:hypothetical protein
VLGYSKISSHLRIQLRVRRVRLVALAEQVADVLHPLVPMFKWAEQVAEVVLVRLEVLWGFMPGQL